MHETVTARQVCDRRRHTSPTAAHFCPGNRLALEHRMAIMWDPPAERPSLEPTPAELAWNRWLKEALIAKNDDGATQGKSTDKPHPPTEPLTPAA